MDAGKLFSDTSLDRARNTPIFPVLHSTLSASELAKEVSREYGIGTPTSCRLLRAKLNDTYVIRTAGERYILRVYRSRWRSLPEISYEVELLLHLRKKGIAVSAPIPRRDGSLVGAIRAPEGIRYMVLTTFAPGTSFSGQHITEQARLFGQVVARFHHAADDFHCYHSRQQLDFTLLLDEPLRAIQPLLAHRPQDWQLLQQFADKIHNHISSFGLKMLDRGPIHGDLTSANAHITQEQRVTLFDFDFCGPGWRAYDLASMYGVARHQNNIAAWETFLRAYREIRPLKESDIYAVPLFDAVGQIWSEGLHAANSDEWGSEWLNDEHFDHMLRTLLDWEAFYTRHSNGPRRP